MSATTRTKRESQRCPFGCGGTLSSVPERRVSLTECIANHKVSCPATAPTPESKPRTKDEMLAALGSGFTIDKGRAPRRTV